MSAVLVLVAIAVSWLGIRLAEERQRLRMYDSIVLTGEPPVPSGVPWEPR